MPNVRNYMCKNCSIQLKTYTVVINNTRCGFEYLKSIKKANRKICCQGGKFATYSRNKIDQFPSWKLLPPALLRIATTRLEHLSKQSTYYNNILSIGSTGVDNGRGGGFEKFNMDHSVKLNGRTYHYFGTNKSTNGLAYFAYDGLDRVTEHVVQSLNLNGNAAFEERVKIDLLTGNTIYK